MHTRDLTSQPLELQELAALFLHAQKSYSAIPRDTRLRITSVATQLLEADFVPLVSKLVAAGMFTTKPEMEQELEKQYSVATCWCVSCFVLGVDHGYGHATLEELTRYPVVLSQPFCLFASAYLKQLAQHHSIDEAESARQSGQIADRIVSSSLELAFAGRDQHALLAPASPNRESKFILALREYPFLHPGQEGLR